MNWQDVAQKVIAAGAPAIGEAIAGPFGASIGGALAGILGVDPTPDAVGGSVVENPSAVQRAEADPPPQLSAWLETHARIAESLTATETSRENWFSWAWRPALSWLLGFLYLWNGVLLPVANAAFIAGIAPMPWDQLTAFTGIWVVIYGGGHTVKSIWGK